MPSPPEGQDNSLQQGRAFNFLGLLIFSSGKELYPEYRESRGFEETDGADLLVQLFLCCYDRSKAQSIPDHCLVVGNRKPSSVHPHFVPAFLRVVTSHFTCKFEMNTWDLTFNDGWNMLTKLSHSTLCNLSPHETEPNTHIGHDLRKKKKKVWYFMICIENMILISYPLPCAGAVCICPWCHFGGMSLWQHGHSSLWVQIHILQHQQTGSTDQFQPDKRWVSGNLMCLSHYSWCIEGV